MKKGILFIMLFSGCLVGKAQFYVSPSIGYGFPIRSLLAVSENTYGAAMSPTPDYVTIITYGSYGNGMHYGGVAGFGFKKMFSIEAGYERMISRRIRSEMNDTVSYGYEDRMEVVMTGKMNVISLAGGINVSGPKWSVFIKTGILFGFNGEINNENIATFGILPYSDIYDKTEQYSGGNSLGFEGKFGVKYLLNENWSIDITSFFSALQWAPLKGEVVKYERNGTDIRSQFTTYQNRFEFVESYESNYSYNGDEPSQRMKSYYSFSSYGMSFGVTYRINFGKHKTGQQ